MGKKITVLSFLGGLGIGILGLVTLQFSQTHSKSPYVAQTDSPVHGLSPQEIDDLLNGRGAGYARMAELNSYPGPRHVLDLRQELRLSTDQVEMIQTTFDSMQQEAQRLGERIVTQEKQLSQAFATESITPELLDQQTQDLADLYGDLRLTHLQAHLVITPVLSAEQIEHYDQLRGYTEPSTVPHHHFGD
ncbi:MAG: hypothetical protein AAF215_22685 [Cyanobacteria bacterium P01_A01_bin.123]